MTEKSMSDRKICDKCGAKNELDSQYCENCGQLFTNTEPINTSSQADDSNANDEHTVSNVIYCPNCGNENDKNNIFCFKCGACLDKKKGVKKDNDNPLKPLLTVILFTVIFLGLLLGFLHYKNIQISKEPYSTTWLFADTNTHISASYNDDYDVINIDLTIDEIIEPWQIEEIGSNITEIKIICKTYDGLKKEFNFKDITLNSGEKIKGRYTEENATLKDFVMVKSLLQGEVTISYSQPLEMDNQKRLKLKRAHYERKEEQRRAKEAADALDALGGLMLFNAMF